MLLEDSVQPYYPKQLIGANNCIVTVQKITERRFVPLQVLCIHPNHCSEPERSLLPPCLPFHAA